MLALEVLRLQEELLSRTVWFLDFDGSLCPHLEVWQERCYDPHQILTLVRDLAAEARGVLWNTGRRVESLGSILPEFLDFSGYFMQGSARWEASLRQEALLGELLPSSYAALFEKLLETRSDRLRLEIKRSSLRVAPLLPADLSLLEELWMDPAFEALPGWTWHVGARGAELLHNNFDKGLALRQELARYPADSLPVVVGDDLLDRPAVVEALARGGFVFLVGEHCGWVTEVPHKAWQVIYCQDAAETCRRIRDLLKNP